MSRFSTSKMLGKLGSGQNEARAEIVETENADQHLTEPQLRLTPSEQPAEELKKVLSNILGTSFSKGYSPMEK